MSARPKTNARARYSGGEFKVENTRWPSLRVTVRVFATYGLFLARNAFTVTTSPGFSESLFQPRLNSELGLASSKSQLTTLPVSSSTST